MRPVRDRRLAEINRRIGPQPRVVPAELSEWLGTLTEAQLRRLEVLSEEWPDLDMPMALVREIVLAGDALAQHGLELALVPVRQFTRAEIEAMGPHERASAYRELIHRERTPPR
jgi:hypothetical protein